MAGDNSDHFEKKPGFAIFINRFNVSFSMSIDDKSLKFYTVRAKEYAAHVRNPKDSVYHAYYEKPAMYALLPDLNGKTILSIGCGSGEDSIHLKRQGAEKSIGIDISHEMIGIAKDSYPECEFHIMNMEDIDFPDCSFDFAYSSLAIHHVQDWSKVFTHVYRILKPGSSFLFSCGHPLRFAMDDSEDGKYLTMTLEIRENTETHEFLIKGDYLVKRKTIDAPGQKYRKYLDHAHWRYCHRRNGCGLPHRKAGGSPSPGGT